MTVRISFIIRLRLGRIDDGRFDDKFVPSGYILLLLLFTRAARVLFHASLSDNKNNII